MIHSGTLSLLMSEEHLCCRTIETWPQTMEEHLMTTCFDCAHAAYSKLLKVSKENSCTVEIQESTAKDWCNAICVVSKNVSSDLFFSVDKIALGYKGRILYDLKYNPNLNSKCNNRPYISFK